MIEYALYIVFTFNSGIVETKLDNIYTSEIECNNKASDITENKLNDAIDFCDRIDSEWWPTRNDVSFCEIIDAISTVNAHCEEMTK